MHEDRPALSATELLRTESSFQRRIDYVNVAIGVPPLGVCNQNTVSEMANGGMW